MNILMIKPLMCERRGQQTPQQQNTQNKATQQPPCTTFTHRYLSVLPHFSFSQSRTLRPQNKDKKEHKRNNKKGKSFKDSLSFCITAEKTSATVQACQGSARGRAGTQIPKPTTTHTDKKTDMRVIRHRGSTLLGGAAQHCKRNFLIWRVL